MITPRSNVIRPLERRELHGDAQHGRVLLGREQPLQRGEVLRRLADRVVGEQHRVEVARGDPGEERLGVGGAVRAEQQTDALAR